MEQIIAVGMKVRLKTMNDLDFIKAMGNVWNSTHEEEDKFDMSAFPEIEQEMREMLEEQEKDKRIKHELESESE